MRARSKGFFGIEIGGTKIQVVVASTNLKIKQRRRFVVDRARGAAGILQQIQSAVSELLQNFQPLGVGIGFGGPVDWKTGRTCCSHTIEGWSDFDLRRWTERLLRARVVVDNDANIAALGEAIRGAGRAKNPVFYVTLGSGVGGGLVVDGAIYHGAMPGESEIGHLRLDRSNTRVEQRCSGWAVDQRIREACTARHESLLCELLDKTPGGEAKHLAVALRQKDSLAHEILDKTAEDLAFALSHVTHLVHPEMIILGGGLSLLGEPLRTAVAAHLPRFLMEAFHPGPEIRLAALAEDAVPIGCLIAAKQLLTDRSKSK